MTITPSHEVVIPPNGIKTSEYWWIYAPDNGWIFHREDGPANIIYHENGTIKSKEWYRYGKRHREDGPAVVMIGEDNSVEFVWYIDDKCHRDEAPAYTQYKDGILFREAWWVDGLRHREDGPAYAVYPKKTSSALPQGEKWFLCGEYFNRSSFKEIIELANNMTREYAIMNIKNPSKYIRMKCQEVLNVNNH